mmetsp:Transcript_28558/g.37386  ORF Transcript_28558/g.37386 Transcript_28558/m.37386 type:complete len:143 (-) Transcript_28558:244-672(-)|eukprot:CAMPEP_0117753704 /NCGR_PEP_ID=MMETSP0947-20121206/12392_1 /TAXON_ID=44440 /ORGANISM="Chattonella subsalsa, Strain CCMP2191" /LENGTH=142 /DNA_ID=CAMNT_0005572653 /DNA_START=64 /DNA_END=492 /DNA_ORIENTATION=+
MRIAPDFSGQASDPVITISDQEPLAVAVSIPSDCPTTIQHAVPVTQTDLTEEDAGPPVVITQLRAEVPEDYLVFAWLSCLCFCPPLGMMALIQSRHVHDYYREGDVQAAKKASEKAKMYALSAYATGLVTIFVILLTVNVVL